MSAGRRQVLLPPTPPPQGTLDRHVAFAAELISPAGDWRGLEVCSKALEVSFDGTQRRSRKQPPGEISSDLY